MADVVEVIIDKWTKQIPGQVTDAAGGWREREKERGRERRKCEQIIEIRKERGLRRRTNKTEKRKKDKEC